MVYTPCKMRLGHNISVLSMHCINILSTIYCNAFNITGLHFQHKENMLEFLRIFCSHALSYIFKSYQEKKELVLST